MDLYTTSRLEGLKKWLGKKGRRNRSVGNGIVVCKPYCQMHVRCHCLL